MLRPAQQPAELQDIVRAAHEGERYVIDPHLEPEREIAAILRRERIGAQLDPGEIQTLVIPELSSDHDLAAKTAALFSQHAKLELAVVEEDAVPNGDIPHEAGVDRGDATGTPLHAPIREEGLLSSLEPHEPAPEFPDAKLGTLEIEEQTDEAPDVGGRSSDAADGAGMRCPAAVGKIEPRDVHARADHPREHHLFGRARAYGRNDLRAAH